MLCLTVSTDEILYFAHSYQFQLEMFYTGEKYNGAAIHIGGITVTNSDPKLPETLTLHAPKHRTITLYPQYTLDNSHVDIAVFGRES